LSKPVYRALVTGGAGFIGSTLVDRLLAEGHEVDVVDNLSTGSLGHLSEARGGGSGRFHFHQLDVRSPDLPGLMVRRRPDVVFHLAAPADVKTSVGDPVADADVNVLGSLRALEGARQAGARKFVFASSGGTIYGQASSFPVKESQAQAPLSPYGVSKKVVGDYLYAYRRLYGLEFTTLALANVYGPRQSPTGGAGVVAAFAGRLLDGQPCIVYGDGEQTRDFVFVDDVVDAFSRAGDKGSGLLCNVGTGKETSVNALYWVMARHAGVGQPPVYAPARAGEPARNSLDPSRAAIHLGWKPWTSLEKGTATVLDWCRDLMAGRP
jgi:UDP-glucose 4-epimerase